MANYLYNGEPLPKLPEWDMEKYPYAFIWFQNSILPKWVLIAIPAVAYNYMANGEWALYVENGIQIGWTIKVDEAGNLQSEEWMSATPWHGYLGLDSVTWSNFDVLNEDGTLYLAASEPVPVTQPVPKVSPQLAFTIGKQLGRRIFR